MPSTFHDWLALPMVGLAVAIVLTVIGARLTTNSANGLLIAAWVLATASIFILPFVAKLDVIPRILWTALFASVAGLVLYQLRWTDPVILVSSKAEPQSTAPASSAKPPEVPTAMPSLLSLYMTDFKGKGSGGGVSLSSDLYTELTFKNNTILRIFYQIHDDYGNRSKFLSFYIPPSPHTYEAIEFLATGYKKHLNLPIKLESGDTSSPSVTKSSELVFTGRVFIYYETTLTLSELGKLDDVYRKQGLSPRFYTTPYALSAWESIRSGNAKPLPKYELRDGIPRKVADPNAIK
jgi:hypothetical protein